TTSIEPLAEARKLGLSVVVIDHHQTGDELPEVDALVNPNRADDLSGLGHLAAVGLVLVTLVAVNRELRGRGFWTSERPEPDLLGMLHHVALGTVADVAPLTGLNRAFVAKGLIAMRRRDHIGHTALMDVSRLNGPPEAWHLGFMLGPRINAGGRIGRADLGVRLLLEGDVSEAARIAAELDRLNNERRVIEQAAEAQAEAEALASLGLEDNGSVIVTASEGWHPGVVGLVAARLKEKFVRPAFAIALEPGGIGTGSGRSIGGVDLGKAVRQAVADGLLLKGGGHAMAAGVTLRKEKLAEFRAYMENALAHDVAHRAMSTNSSLTGRSARVARPPNSRRLSIAPVPSAAAIPSRCWRCRRISSCSPTRSGRRTCGCASSPATAPSSTASPSAPSARSSAMRCWRSAARWCMSRDRLWSTAIRDRSACSFACSTSPCPIRGRR